MSIPIEDFWWGKVDLSEVVDANHPRPEPVTPGEMLLEEFMKPLGLTAPELASALRVPTAQISRIIAGRRSITPIMALRLGRYFNMTPDFWLNLQAHHALRRALEREGDRIVREVRPRSQAA